MSPNPKAGEAIHTIERCPMCGYLTEMTLVKHKDSGLAWVCGRCSMVIPDKLMLAYSNKRMKVMGVAKL